MNHPNYNTLGASIDKITMTTFAKRETIGGHDQTMLEGLRRLYALSDRQPPQPAAGPEGDAC